MIITQDDNDFIYNPDEAAEVVWNNIPQNLQEKYSLEEIYFMLHAEFDYMNSIGMVLDEDEELPVFNYPIDVDETKMKNYIGAKAIKNRILTNDDELSLILEAESIYFEMNGALQDRREYLN